MGAMTGTLRAGILTAVVMAGPAAAEPPVTEAEAREVLAELEEAYRREDLAGILARYSEGLRPGVRQRLVTMFRERNYLRLEHRVLAVTTDAGGDAALDVAAVLRSRRVTDAFDRREKTRWRYELDRADDGTVRIVDAGPAERRVLSGAPTWEPAEWTGEVRLDPRRGHLGTPEGDVAVTVAVTLRNVTPSPARVLGFALHPHVRRLAVARGGRAMELQRDEGPGDTWWGELDPAVEPGGTLRLELDYELDLVGPDRHAQLGPDGGHLFTESAWLPLFGIPRHEDPARAVHDLTVVVPGDLVAVAPGTLASVEARPQDRRAHRFFSRFPGHDLPVVVGRFQRRQIPLTEELTLELVAPGASTAPVPERLVSVLSGLARLAADVLGPPPTSSVVVVEAGGPDEAAMRAAPAFLVLGSTDLPAPNPGRPETPQPYFFVAHHLAHLWFVDSVEARGPGAIVLTESLSDHLATAWVEEDQGHEAGALMRARLLRGLEAYADGDRPLAREVDGLPHAEFLGRGKGRLVLDAYRAFAGETRWREALASYWRSARGGGAVFGDLVRALAGDDPRLQAFCGAWLLNEGVANPAIAEVRFVGDGAEDEPGTVFIELSNEGAGPIPLQVRLLVAQRTEDHRLELGADETLVLELAVPRRPASVQLDPRRLIWQALPGDDGWPPHRETTRPQFTSPQAISPEDIAERIERRGGP